MKRTIILVLSICCILLTACTDVLSAGSQEQEGKMQANEVSESEVKEDNTVYGCPIAVLTFSLMPDDFTLCNAEGEEVFYDSDKSSYTGDLEIFEDFPTTMGYKVYVKDSDSYTFQTENTDYRFSVGGHKFYVNVEGINIREIDIEADGTVQLTGENMEYEVGVNVFEDGLDRVDTSGTGSGTVTIKREKE